VASSSGPLPGADHALRFGFAADFCAALFFAVVFLAVAFFAVFLAVVFFFAGSSWTSASPSLPQEARVSARSPSVRT
jgi:hypothetical protein